MAAFRITEQIAGGLLFLLGLLDVFLTVLYARAGTGIFSRWVTFACWRAMLGISESSLVVMLPPFAQRRPEIVDGAVDDQPASPPCL